MMSKRIQKFDVKIGSITTPKYLSRVFQYRYMKNTLGVNYDSYSGNYVARGTNDEGFDVKPSDEIVYLGFGQWKKKENK